MENTSPSNATCVGRVMPSGGDADGRDRAVTAMSPRVAVTQGKETQHEKESPDDGSSLFMSPFENNGACFESDEEAVGVPRQTLGSPVSQNTQPQPGEGPTSPLAILGQLQRAAMAHTTDLVTKKSQDWRKIGVGSFGTVYRGHHHIHGDVAIKMIPLDPTKYDKSLHDIESEIQVGMSLNHPNIVRIYEARVYKGQGRNSEQSQDAASARCNEQASNAAAMLESVVASSEEVDEMFKSLRTELPSKKAPIDITFLLTQEFCNGGTLSEALERGYFQGADKHEKHDRLKSIALNVAYGIQCMHQNHMVHRDLSSTNVMLHVTAPSQTNSPASSHMTAKLIDFGRTSINTMHTCKTDGQTTISYAAPELMSDGHTSKASDIFSLGVILWEVWTGKRAWGDARAVQIIFAICRGDRLPVPEDMPAELSRVMTQCWTLDPNERPSIEEIIQVLEALPIGDEEEEEEEKEEQ